MGFFLINRWFHAFLLLVILSGAIFIRFQDYEWSRALSYLAFDNYIEMHKRPASDRVIIADIDDKSLLDIGQWPWPRTVLADLVLKLKDMGARSVAFDGVLAEPDRTSPDIILENLPKSDEFSPLRDSFSQMKNHDQIFADAIRQSGIFVSAFSHGSYEQKKAPRIASPVLAKKDTKPEFLAHARNFDGAATFIPVLESAAAGNGSFMAFPEIDGILRKTGIVFTDRSNLYPSLSLEAIRVSLGGTRSPVKIVDNRDIARNQFAPEYEVTVGDYRVPVDRDGVIWVYFRSFDRNKDYVSIRDILHASPGDEISTRIKDKIVFIGSSAEGLKDLRSTPLDLFVPGVEVHANVTEQILQNRYLLRPSILIGAEVVFMIIIGLMIIFMAPFIGAVILALMTACLIGGIAYASWYIFLHYGLLLDPIYPSLTILSLFVMASILAYIRTEAERKHVRDAFSLYISPDFMKELTDHPDKLKLGGEVRELTVMFTDIRSFTTISEKLSPEALIQLMNDFLTPMSSLVMENRGTIDKYMGDAMMAFWNAPLDDENHARHACLTALKMNAALEPINEKIRASSSDPNPLVLAAGIGVNTGPASVGNMGSRQRFAYSALGDTVNLASRLEGQTKSYGVSILIGEETARQVTDLAILELDLLRVKGKTEPARIFTLIGDQSARADPVFAEWEKAHNSMLSAYRAMMFDDAERIIGECEKFSAGRLDSYYRIFRARIAGLKTNRPGGDRWDGVFEATGK